ncbi:MAG: superoxide dismutase [Caulobacter sp.]|nr:superoxide dismutase [Caulobacter sp.]
MFVLPDLPYPAAALEPVISARTLGYHHGKHHKAYVDTLNKLLAESGDSPDSLEAVIRETAGDTDRRKLFNNAAQAWNHAFFWDSMTPEHAPPTADLATAIDAAFGDIAALREAFVTEGVGHFASGWVWLIVEGDALKVISTHDADDTVPLEGVTPLLVCDLWEHAYYLDHQNDRKGFLEAWFDTLANWSLATRQLAASRGEGDVWAYPAPVHR